MQLSVNSKNVELTTTWTKLHIPTQNSQFSNLLSINEKRADLSRSRRRGRRRSKRKDVLCCGTYSGYAEIPY